MTVLWNDVLDWLGRADAAVEATCWRPADAPGEFRMWRAARVPPAGLHREATFVTFTDPGRPALAGAPAPHFVSRLQIADAARDLEIDPTALLGRGWRAEFPAHAFFLGWVEPDRDAGLGLSRGAA
jgi:hypothetical protein